MVSFFLKPETIKRFWRSPLLKWGNLAPTKIMPLDLRATIKSAIHKVSTINSFPPNAIVYASVPTAGSTKNRLGDDIPNTVQVEWQMWLKRVETVSREPSPSNAGQAEVEVPVKGRMVAPLIAPPTMDNSQTYDVFFGKSWGKIRLSPEPPSGFELEGGLADGSGVKLGTRVTGVFTRSPNNRRPDHLTP